MSKLSPLQSRWLRYAAKEYKALQAHVDYVEQDMPARTRDALVARGLMTRETIVGMGGGFTYYQISDKGLALVEEESNR